MKKLFSLLAILGIILASNCSRIPENNDPVIGIWSNVEVKSSQTSKSTIKKEWIFNDAYLGRFHTYNNNKIEVLTDFSWTKEADTYVISYPGLENKTNDLVVMKKSESGMVLEDTNGHTLAIRE
jgi:hypothetical protein